MRTFTASEYEQVENFPLGDAIALGLIEEVATDTYLWR